ncbi:hypothetical protein GJW-30_1_02530 [Variibacter gotjawalensis]|uniref:DUF2147 domain-containing protein n=1 Tax=Variibacter gotjawalensis TaxID=1333996 RepID=A0A0S3PVM2_9BRAD|nr:DUF2147 domain-containing protein [Variibacter gotjawalensis]NIK45817.1 uncharacterized protein (DUF2147 family) [Variibacter gotjawalensis]RZS47741.1 uncharacterized protein (DUF2147 family) [Variibacter gotjawalensis]BAT59995.1 hypothetical protein GJW-30_1_02530 [Variibacter gotjawalensis]
MRSFFVAASLVIAMAGTAFAADPIAGNWTTQAGSTAAIAPCGSAFCITLRSGEHSGKRIGNMAPKGAGKYAGTIVDPATDKSYTGSASLSGNTLSLSGCVMGGMICKSQTWTRR